MQTSCRSRTFGVHIWSHSSHPQQIPHSLLPQYCWAPLYSNTSGIWRVSQQNISLLQWHAQTMFLASWNSMSHIPLECIWWMGLVLNPGTYLSRWPWILTLAMSYAESVIFRCKPTNLDSTFLTWFLHSGIQLTCPHAKHWTARSQDPEMAN